MYTSASGVLRAGQEGGLERMGSVFIDVRVLQTGKGIRKGGMGNYDGEERP